MDDLSMYVPNVHFEQIPIKNLVSDQEYQRNLSIKHVRKAAENFDLYQINPVKVSRRNGINYVFNGQHTIEIVAMVSGSRETPVWCMIYDDLEYSHEADIFANQMKYVKPLLPYEIFIANIEAGSDKHLLIRDLVESYNLKITPSACTGGICAVSTLEKIIVIKCHIKSPISNIKFFFILNCTFIDTQVLNIWFNGYFFKNQTSKTTINSFDFIFRLHIYFHRNLII